MLITVHNKTFTVSQSLFQNLQINNYLLNNSKDACASWFSLVPIKSTTHRYVQIKKNGHKLRVTKIFYDFLYQNKLNIEKTQNPITPVEVKQKKKEVLTCTGFNFIDSAEYPISVPKFGIIGRNVAITNCGTDIGRIWFVNRKRPNALCVHKREWLDLSKLDKTSHFFINVWHHVQLEGLLNLKKIDCNSIKKMKKVITKKQLTLLLNKM